MHGKTVDVFFKSIHDMSRILRVSESSAADRSDSYSENWDRSQEGKIADLLDVCALPVLRQCRRGHFFKRWLL